MSGYYSCIGQTRFRILFVTSSAPSCAMFITVKTHPISWQMFPMSIQSDKLRELVLSVVATVESRGLFVHSSDLEIKYRSSISKKKQMKTSKLPLIVCTCFLNALVPRSAILFVGGH